MSSLRKKPVRKAKQPPMALYELKGGPWAGSKERLPGKTLVFKCRGFHGRYVKGKWEDVQVN